MLEYELLEDQVVNAIIEWASLPAFNKKFHLVTKEMIENYWKEQHS